MLPQVPYPVTISNQHSHSCQGYHIFIYFSQHKLSDLNMANETQPRGIKRRAPSGTPEPLQKKSRVETQKVRFLIKSDTHDLNFATDSTSAFRYPTEPLDVVLHCGDLTENGSPESIEAALQMLGSIDAELKLVIAGNHELSLDRDYWIGEGGSEEEHKGAVSMVAGDLAQKCGITSLNEGTHTFALKSGARSTSYASPYTPKFGMSAFQYPSNEDRYNPVGQTPAWAVNTSTPESCIPEGIDIVMTHGPAKFILDNTRDGDSVGCEHLRRALCRTKPKLHCFGHVHPSWGAQKLIYPKELAALDDEDDGVFMFPKEYVGINQAKRKGYACLSPGSAESFLHGEECLAINAAVENGDEPNAPWMVDLQLLIE